MEIESGVPPKSGYSQSAPDAEDPQSDQPDQQAESPAPSTTFSALRRSAAEPVGEIDPQFSPDGKWWWNGSNWRPYQGADGLLAMSTAAVSPGKPDRGDLKSARDHYRQADKAYKDAIKAADLRLRQAQDVHASAISVARKNLAGAEAAYAKAVGSAQQALSEWTAPGTGRRIDSLWGITLYEHAIATPQGSASLYGASASVDAAGNLAVTKRVTLTRLVAGGIIGGLIFQKKTKDDTRELYIVIETPTVVSAVKCPPDQGPKARQFAAKVQQQSNWESGWLKQRETAQPQAAMYFAAIKKDTSRVESARTELARTLSDAAHLDAIAASRKELNSARSDVPRREAAGARLLAVGEHVQEIRPIGVPPLDKLNTKEEELLQSQLTDGERFVSAVVGKGGQACVATDRRVLILKLNLLAGASKGATALAYSEIAGVQIRTSLGSGEIEFHKADIRSTAFEIAISFDGNDEPKFREFEALVAARAADAFRSSPFQLAPPAEASTFAESDEAAGAHAEKDVLAASESTGESDNERSAQGVAQASETPQQDGGQKPDRYAQLLVLGELSEQGILTEAEFQAEKAKILAG